MRDSIIISVGLIVLGLCVVFAFKEPAPKPTILPSYQLEGRLLDLESRVEGLSFFIYNHRHPSQSGRPTGSTQTGSLPTGSLPTGSLPTGSLPPTGSSE